MDETSEAPVNDIAEVVNEVISAVETSTSTPTTGMPARAFRIDTVRDVFHAGIDVTSTEEQARRAARAHRFGIAEYNPVEDVQGVTLEELAMREKRKERFASSVTDQVEYLDSGQHDEDSAYPCIFRDDALKRIPEKEAEAETSAWDIEAQRRWDVVHLFGSKMLADNMRTEHLLNMFAEYGAKTVEWISDYRCNLVFGDPLSARRALFMLSKANNDDITRAIKYIVDNTISVGFSQDDLQFVVWRTAVKLGHDTQSSLCMRVATVLDVKGGDRAKSVYYERNAKHRAQLANMRAKRRAEEAKQGLVGGPGGMGDQTLETQQGDEQGEGRESATLPPPPPVVILGRDGQPSRLTSLPPVAPRNIARARRVHSRIKGVAAAASSAVAAAQAQDLEDSGVVDEGTTTGVTGASSIEGDEQGHVVVKKGRGFRDAGIVSGDGWNEGVGSVSGAIKTGRREIILPKRMDQSDNPFSGSYGRSGSSSWGIDKATASEAFGGGVGGKPYSYGPGKKHARRGRNQEVSEKKQEEMMEAKDDAMFDEVAAAVGDALGAKLVDTHDMVEGQGNANGEGDMGSGDTIDYGNKGGDSYIDNNGAASVGGPSGQESMEANTDNVDDRDDILDRE